MYVLYISYIGGWVRGCVRVYIYIYIYIYICVKEAYITCNLVSNVSSFVFVVGTL
jgi:hypothetical protein